MRIRRYTGKDAQEAMLKVKMDLGSEALILSTRKVRQKGFKGFFGKPLTEVLAAIDEEYGNKKQTASDIQKSSRQQSGGYNRFGSMQKSSEGENRVESLENRMKNVESVLERIYYSVSSNSKPLQPDMTEKACTPPPVATAAKIRQEPAATFAKPVMEREMPESGALKTLRKVLLDREIEPSIIEKMTNKIKQFVKNPNDYDEIYNVAEKVLLNVLGQPKTIEFRGDDKPTIVLFAGPTGVGKTTTLAKIAAEFTLNQQKKIGFITADTYRIAAVEQLRIYAEILGIPISVIYSPQETKEAILQHSDKDLILIDTAGRSQKAPEQLSELKMLINAAEVDEIYLVLSCSMGRLALREVINQYRFLKNYKLLFTKLDEVLVPSVILNASYATGKSLSYTTAGQNVPDDIEVANVPDIVKSILQTKINSG